VRLAECELCAPQVEPAQIAPCAAAAQAGTVADSGIEYQHRGAGTPTEEIKKCYTFVRQALA
jgi:hypothetical protein